MWESTQLYRHSYKNLSILGLSLTATFSLSNTSPDPFKTLLYYKRPAITKRATAIIILKVQRHGALFCPKNTHTHTLVVYKYRNMLYPKRSKCRFYAARRRTRLKKKRDKGCARVRAPLVLIPLPDFFRLFSTVFLPCRDAKIIKSRSAREISAHIHFLPITASVRLMSGFCGTCVCIYIYTPREQ